MPLLTARCAQEHAIRMAREIAREKKMERQMGITSRRDEGGPTGWTPPAEVETPVEKVEVKR